jgi:hypothetical protein
VVVTCKDRSLRQLQVLRFDKDLYSALLAEQLDSDLLVMRVRPQHWQSRGDRFTLGHRSDRPG